MIAPFTRNIDFVWFTHSFQLCVVVRPSVAHNVPRIVARAYQLGHHCRTSLRVSEGGFSLCRWRGGVRRALRGPMHGW